MYRLSTLLIIGLCATPPSFSADTPGSATLAPTQATTTASDTNYADRTNWLCWPGKSLDACEVNLTTTVVDANGHTRVEKFRRASKPPIDCFYVYPTVSAEPGINSTLAIASDEQFVVAMQFARFGARCRLFAPMYRQLTLAGLRAALSGHPMPGTSDPAVRDLGYNDVKSAWEYYLRHENHGRGVVLIGHSQGSVILDRLIASEIDGKPEQALLVSAILMGWNIAVPSGADVGGDFASIPLCRGAAQTGCVIAFASFRANSPPPANSVFGKPRPPRPGMVAACVNPAALAGGAGELKAYFSSTPQLIAGHVAEPTPWAKNLSVATPYVSVPGLLSAECATTDQFNYLAVSVHADSSDVRTSDIPGDLTHDGVVLTDWGLHLIDANLTIGNLLDVVDAEAKAWMAKRP
ncbi:MAG: DUF3089 domain-containing protein [Steroidobacteraceae bacterium]|jgi:hypothetical protein